MRLVQVDADAAQETIRFAEPSQGIERELVIVSKAIVGLTVRAPWDELGKVYQLVRERTALEADQIALFRLRGALGLFTPPVYEDNEIVCECLEITRGTLMTAIREGFNTFDALVEKTGATTECGSCEALVREMLGEEAWIPVHSIQVMPVAEAIQSFRIKPHHKTLAPAKAGQHILIQAEIEGKRVQRAYTISSAAQETTYREITVKREPHGFFSRWLFDRRQDDSVIRISQPQGSYFADLSQKEPIVCLVAGIGMTPALAICRSMLQEGTGQRLHIDYSVSKPSQLAYADELRQAAATHENIELRLRITREEGRLSSDDVQQLVKRYPNGKYYICGPAKFQNAAEAFLREFRVPAERIEIEEFTHAGDKPAVTSESVQQNLPTIEHTGLLEDLSEVRPFLVPGHEYKEQNGRYSCSFCGVGDSGVVTIRRKRGAPPKKELEAGQGLLKVNLFGQTTELRAQLHDKRRLEVETSRPLVPPGGVLNGQLLIDGHEHNVVAREIARDVSANDSYRSQTFTIFTTAVGKTSRAIGQRAPTTGCVKLTISMGLQRPVFPIHIAPSVLDRDTGERRSISYKEAISRLASLLLEYRPPDKRTLIYACGQIDYFSIFSFQEVFRLLGVRNLAGNAEHCLNAGAVHNEMLTSQEGPFLTIQDSLNGPNRFFILSGWNGLITHPPIFQKLLKRPDLDAYLIEVMESESARTLIKKKLGPERVLFIRPGSDPQLALAVAHEILHKYPEAIDDRFVERFSDRDSFERYTALAREESFAPEKVAARIAAEAADVDRLRHGIRDIAAKIAQADVVPINIPSVGLSQTKGAVSHCLWGSMLAMVGKYGLKADGSPAGGTLRIPGQINAQSEVQGLSKSFFMGRLRLTEEGIVEAARRQGLPADAYEMAFNDIPRTALDFSDPTEKPELFLCFGTQFESNMMGRARWIKKLTAPNTKLVVMDPIPDPFTLKYADLIIPPPPHAAAAKLYQNGEWRMTLSIPQKRAAPETRTDATIVYDTMAEISRRLRENPALCEAHPDLARHSESGYLQQRFEPPEQGGQLSRADGEVSRPELWERILGYMADGEGRRGALYCRPEHADGRPIAWEELLEDSIIYGGVGTTRYRLDYDDPNHVPFRDVFRRPAKFKFFVPTEEDLSIAEGIILNSGRSSLSDDKKRVRFATSSFNSGKATTTVNMPDENPLHISPQLAERYGLADGDLARVTGVETGESLILPVVVTDRVKGESVYVSFHKCKAEIEQGRYVNMLTSHAGRCPYTSQSNFKLTRILIERVESSQASKT